MTGEDLPALATAARERYLAAYRQGLECYRSQHANVVAEVMLELTKPSSLFARLNRVDAIWKQDPGPAIREVNVDKPAGGSRSVVFGGIQLSVSPFVWNGVEFVFRDELSLEPGLSAWFGRWMDLDDERPTDEHGLGSIIHSLTVPDWHGDSWRFDVDFGSAPVDAFLELVTLCGATSPPGWQIGSFSYE